MSSNKQNTPGHGIEYEIFVPAYFALVLNQAKDIEDFTIESNATNFGNFDDVVVSIQRENGTTQKFAFQLKHKECKQKKLIPTNFEARGDFNIEKYCQAFSKIEDNHTNYYILLTNARLDTGNKNESTRYRISQNQSCVGSELFNTNPEVPNIYTLELAEDNKPVHLDYQTFFSRFNLYTMQKSFEELKESITDFFKSETIGMKFERLFRKIHGGFYANKIIDKKTLNIHLVDFFLKDHAIRSRSFANSEQFEEVIREFHVTVVNMAETNLRQISNGITRFSSLRIQQQLQTFIKNFQIVTTDFEEAKIDCLIRLAKKYKISEKTIETLSAEVMLTLLHYFFQEPFIINCNTTSKVLICKFFELYKPMDIGIKLVMLNLETDIAELPKFPIFRSLEDLKATNGNLYIKIIKTCCLSLQGRSSSTLEKLLISHAEIAPLIKAEHIYQMLHAKFVIGGNREELPNHYEHRIVSTFSLDLKKVLNYSKNSEDVIIIKSDNIIENAVEIERAAQVDLRQSTLFFTREDITKRKFNRIVQRYQYNRVHYLKVVDNVSCALVMSTNNIFASNHLILKRQYLHEKDVHHFFDHPVNIVCNQPGMGKSTMMKYLKNERNSDYWTVMVDVKAHNAFLKVKHKINDVVDYFTQQQSTDTLSMDLLTVFLHNKKIVIFFDGLDELEGVCIDNILDYVEELSLLGYQVWLSSRENLQQKLEDRLKIFSIKIEEFDDQQQRRYVRSRLQSEYDQEQIETIMDKIFDNPNVLTNRQVLGVPLQLFIISQLFLDNTQLFENLTEDMFVLTKLYRIFFDGRHRYACEKMQSKHSHLNLSRAEDYLERYEMPALQTLLDEDVFGKLKLDLRKHRRFLNEIETERDLLGIIVKLNHKNQAVFEHLTYAEYFASCYLVNNIDKLQLLKRELFSQRYANLMLMLNVMLAENNPLHLAVIYKDLERINLYLHDDNTKYDCRGRNPLHLASCNVTRYEPLLFDLHFSSDYYIIERGQRLIETETSQNQEYIHLLLNFDSHEKDALFEMTALDYAVTCGSFFVVESILQKNQLSVSLDQYGSDPTIAFYAASQGYPILLDSVLNRNDSKVISMRDFYGETLFHLTLQNAPCKTIDVMSALTKHGFEVNVRNDFEETALHLAVRNKEHQNVRWLVENGALVNAENVNGETPLHYAEVVDILSLLVEKGGDINLTAAEGNTLLHYAAKTGNIAVAKYLLRKGVNAGVVNDNKETSFHVAATAGHSDIVDLLVEKDVDCNDKSGKTALHNAASNGNTDVVKLLIEKGASVCSVTAVGDTLLHCAAESGDLTTVLTFLDQQIDVNVANNQGLTPLHFSVKNGHLNITKILLEKGANINTTSRDGNSVLHWTAVGGNCQIIDLVLSKCLDVNMLNQYGETALLLASQNKHFNAINLLVESGANLNIISSNNKTIWDYVRHPQLIRLLLEKGADPNLKDTLCETPLYYAVQSENLNVVSLLLDNGARIDEASLQLAAMKPDTKIKELLQSKCISFNMQPNPNRKNA